ncbi:MAG: hypothetical protein Q9172_002900 [Xanthocarpia lactea]
MSSNSGRPPNGDLYPPAPRYNPSQVDMDYSTHPTQYYDPQAYNLQNQISNALQPNQSANSYAFNTNSRLFNSNSHGGPSLVSPLPQGHDRPENSLASSSYPLKLSSPNGTHSTSHGLRGMPATALTQRAILDSKESSPKPPSRTALNGIRGGRLATENPNSDMEDGELSEGADSKMAGARFSDSGESIGHPSLTANGTGTRKPLEQDAFGQDETGPHERNAVVTHVVNGVLKSGLNRDLHKKSLKDWRNGARHAVAQLKRHDIGYAQLLGEHIHPDLLRKLYLELATDSSQQTQTTTSSSKPPMQAVQPHPLPQKLPEPTLNRHTTDINENMSAMNGTKSSINAEPTRSLKGSELDKPEVGDSTTHALEIGEQPRPQTKSEHQRPSRKAIGQPATGNGLAPQANNKSSREPVSNAPSSNGKPHAPVAMNTKSIAAPAIAQKSLQSSTTHSTVKPPIPKAATKPIDRKDYIARLQAAKAGKVAPAISASQLSLGSTTQKTLQDSSPSITRQLGAASPSINVSSKGNLSEQITGSVESSATALHSANIAAEVKKREQTELARKKIEELKNRSNLTKETLSANNEASLPVASTNQQVESMVPSVEAPLNKPSTKTTTSDAALPTPQHAYFPFRSSTFSLPGLFMSTAGDRDSHQTAAPQTAFAQDGPRDGGEIEPGITCSSVAESPLSQPFSTLQSLVPSSQEEKQISKTATTSHGTQSLINNNPRKRPTAADFIEAAPSKVQRSYSYKADSSVVFEVSDDEADESENQPSDVEMSGNPDVEAPQPRNILAPYSAANDDLNSRQHSALDDIRGKPEKSNSRLSVAHPRPQTPSKKDADGLRAREEEIERMNRKIIEMEQRRKLRQDVNRTQTPGTTGHSTPFLKTGESISNVQSTPDGTKQLSEALIQNTSLTRENGDAPSYEATAGKLMSAEQQDESLKQKEEVQPLVGFTEHSTMSAKEQQLRRRKTEIESELASADAAAGSLRIRLEILHKDEEDLQTQIEQQIEAKRVLQEELDKLLQASLPSPALSGQADDEAIKFPLACDGKQAVTNLPLEPAQGDRQKPADGPTNISHEALGGKCLTTKPETGSPSETALSIEAPTNQSSISGELAEDVMDISGSDDEGGVTQNNTTPSADAGQLMAESDSEEFYEPPSSFGGLEDGSNPITDLSKKQQSLTNESLQQHHKLEAEHVPPPTDNSAATEAHMAAEDQLRIVPPPGYAQSPIDSSDSDDYEPPEPVASVDLAPLTSDAAAALSDSSFSPLDANHTLRANSASSDPLPASIDQTPSEREASAQIESEQLTQASNVADDMILVQMGAIPEGLSEEQRSAFVVGLRQTIQEIRVRKVKDFKIVASEIAAYRARFLGDSSKILPL